jgi:hypothetical protein
MIPNMTLPADISLALVLGRMGTPLIEYADSTYWSAVIIEIEGGIRR